MSRHYPLAVNAATALALSELAAGLDHQTLHALTNALRRDQVKLVLIAQRTQVAQEASTCLSILNLYRACRAIEGIERVRQALAPLLDEPERAVFDEVVRANLAALLDRQEFTSQAVLTWFYQKGESA